LIIVQASWLPSEPVTVSAASNRDSRDREDLVGGSSRKGW
jgi:hypothetical protein